MGIHDQAIFMSTGWPHLRYCFWCLVAKRYHLGKNGCFPKKFLSGARICFRFYQYLPMMETHVLGYQVKATPLQGTMVQDKVARWEGNLLQHAKLNHCSYIALLKVKHTHLAPLVRWSVMYFVRLFEFRMVGQLGPHEVFFSAHSQDKILLYFWNKSLTTVSPKRKYTLLSSWVLKTEGGQMKSRRCAKPTIELVQLKDRCAAPPTFLLAPLDFEYLALPQVYTFFRWRLYYTPT